MSESTSSPPSTEGEQAAAAICRKNFSEFYYAAMFLPRAKRDAVYVVGAFLRMIYSAVVDSDSPQETSCSTGDSTASMLRDRLDEIYASLVELPLPEFCTEDQHILRSFMVIVKRFEIPKQCFLDFATGLRNDSAVKRYATWSALEKSCDLTGGSIARAMSCVLGLTHSEAIQHMSTLGRAMRWTRILCDIAHDSRRGRILLPLEDMAKFRYSNRDLSSGIINTAFRELMRFEVERARELFKNGAKGIRWLGGDGARVAASIAVSWHLGILDTIEQRNYDVFAKPVKLTFARQFRMLPRIWNLARGSGIIDPFMPTIPLYTEPTHPDGWRRVASPGGYETWNFDAQDFQHDRRLVMTFYDGCILHPDYAKACADYLKNPTHRLPPMPNEFVGIEIALYEADKPRFQLRVRYPSNQFSAAVESSAIKIGENRVEPQNDGSLRLVLNAPNASGELTFRPRVQSQPISLNNGWLMIQPFCAVEGELQIEGSTIAFDGMGYHDHQFSTKLNSKTLFSGRLLSEDRMCAFHITDNTAQLVLANEKSVRVVEPEAHFSGEPHSAGTMIRYPSEINLGQFLHLSDPRVVDATLVRARMTYDAAIEEDRPFKAWCEIIHPHRAAWPLSGWLGQRWIEMP